MDIVICDICGRRIEQPRTHNLGVRFEMPLFQSPEKFTMETTDLCLSCGLELSQVYMGLKNKRFVVTK